LRDGHKPLSQMLQDLCDEPREEVSLGEIVHAFGRRALGALLFVFAVPNLLPLPPGSSTILGAPLMLLAPQVAIGVRGAWLPRGLRQRPIPTSEVKLLLARFIPTLQKVERASRPRLTFLFGPIGDRAIGVVCTLLAFVLILPIPLGNLLPAFTIGTLALALFQRDGVIALVGYASAAVSVGLLVLSANVVVIAVHKLAHWVGGWAGM
jgi:hypothetical protein